ncbi:hypothetical protein [Rhizorhapis sp. SPR117]|uniref:hypothetical protein n=1 Tax=Rhizorhapis sp. SPR117 TaxID=2912611 RepID=UPI001F42B7C4|nr:hypothetical protein [Rhizorhapis sp. SPR117]
MTPAVIFSMLMTPPLPPSGPVVGRIECLFGAGEKAEAGSVQFNEAGIAFEGIMPLVVGDAEKPQVRMIQLPVDGKSISGMEFNADRSITIHGQPGGQVIGKFSSIKRALDDRMWMEFSIPSSSDELNVVGTCIADVRGRLDRPVRLTRITTMRVD